MEKENELEERAEVLCRNVQSVHHVGLCSIRR